MRSLFAPPKKGRWSGKNRFIRSATWEELANQAGHLTERIIDIYVTLAKQNVGLLITGATTVSQDDWAMPRMLGMYGDEFIGEHESLTASVHGQGTDIWMQLAFMGCNAYESHRKREVAAMDKDEIKQVVQDFAHAALRAQKAGYDGVQIQAAHGFLPGRFLSPQENERRDEYGGALENRWRLLQDIYQAVREITGTGFLVTVKINSEDFTPKGLSFAESLLVCQQLATWGVDAIQVSGNSPSRIQMKTREKEAYFKDFAMQLADLVDIPVILSGGLKHKETMEEILNNSKVEYFALARPLLCEPGLISRWMSGDEGPAKCVYCNNCYNMPGHICVCNHR